MAFTVTISNNGHSFSVMPGESILAAAKRQDVSLPYGCAGGVCGACIFTIMEGSVEYPDGQPFALFDEDIAANKGLCCVGNPASDLVIQLQYPDEDFEPWDTDD